MKTFSSVYGEREENGEQEIEVFTKKISSEKHLEEIITYFNKNFDVTDPEYIYFLHVYNIVQDNEFKFVVNLSKKEEEIQKDLRILKENHYPFMRNYFKTIGLNRILTSPS